MSVSQPLVSVIIPAYDAALYLREAVESLCKQTYKNLQIIIINDGSRDNTADIANCLAVQDPRIEVIHKKNAGVSAARNNGFEAVKGEYLCFLDADDVYLPQKIAKQVAFLEVHRDVDLVYCDNYLGDKHLQITEPPASNCPPIAFQQAFVYRNWFSPIAPMLRTSLMKKVGLFDASFHGGEDRDYWIRCLAYTDFAYLPEALGIYRRHPKQSHHNQSMMRRDGLRVIQKHYGKDAYLYRLAKGARHWSFAKRHKYFNQPFRMIRELMLFTLNVRNPVVMRFIMRVVD